VKELLRKNKQFLFYCLIGGCGTAITCLCYALLVQFAHVHYQIANAVGYGVGTLFSFALNARYNFRTQDKPLLRLASFTGVALLGWAAAAGILALLVGHYRLNALFAYPFVILVVLLLQYNLNRLVSFKKSTAKQSE
jgi:putative flippase GtrA